MAIPVKNNFCIAPFTQLTISPKGGYSPCPEIGGQPWVEKNYQPAKMWNSQPFEDLRNSFLKNEKNPICERCWTQESVGKTSLRRNLFKNNTSGAPKFQSGQLLDWLDGQYKIGPKQINLMVGNKCNLRCRYCNVGSSVTYNVEGKVYSNLNPDQSKVYFNNNIKQIEFTSEQIQEIYEISNNLTRLEFYGGEPLLDNSTIKLLEKYVTSGRSKSITLFYNTNGANEIKPVHWQLWKEFKSIEFNFSIDDINSRYSYIRHPAEWTTLVDNINKIKNYDWQIPVQLTAISTIGILNVYYVPELLDELENLKLPVYLNNVNDPKWYDMQYLPSSIKLEILEKLSKYKQQEKIEFIVNYLRKQENLEHWRDFKFWTKTKDEYRKENFANTYPEFYKVISKYDDFYGE